MSDLNYKRPIRSFVRREGRMTAGQKRAIEELWPTFGIGETIESEIAALDFDKIFGNDSPVILEIGFGDGESLAETAAQHKDKNFIGIEVHRPGVGNLLLRLEKAGVNNVRVISMDAVQVLKNNIADSALSAVHLFFPDPWHKKRHHKRRIVQTEFVGLIAKKLKQHGRFYVATDWEDYAEHIQDVMNECAVYKVEEDFQDYKSGYRTTTRFETRGKRLGHSIWDLIYIVQ